MANIINAITTGAGGLSTTADASGSIQIATNNGTTAMTIDTSQNVGIGTSSPGQKLDVSGSTTSDIYRLRSNQTAPSSTDAFIYRPADNTIALGTNSTERMRIDSSGNVLIGASTNANNGKVAVTANANSQEMIAMYDTTTSAYGGYYIAFRNSSNALAGYILHNGATTVTYNSVSDYRLKENIKPIENALDRVAKIKPVTYTWKNTDGEQGEGFIAHELQEVCPLAVGGNKDDVDETGGIKPQGIDYSKITALLTKAIQEQQTIINDLKARITALEGAK